MKGTCALSGIETDLQLSHIYPKFTIRYLKDSSTGFFRGYKNVNIGYQDGLKEYLLSKESEQRFSKAETWFANNFFHPVIKESKTVFSYDNHLYYFILSLLWRTLLLQIRNDGIKREPYYGFLLDCEKQWRSFLQDGYLPPVYRNVFMLITHPDSIVIDNLKSAQYYFLRNLDSTIITSKSGSVYMYAKLPRFIFWAPISSPNFSEANHIDLFGGNFNSRETPEEPTIAGFLVNRIVEINSLKVNLSSKQENVILDRIKKDPEKFFNSETGRLIVSGW